MNGVEILSLEVIYNTFLPDWGIVVGLIFMFVSFIAVFAFMANNKHILMWVCCGLTIAFLILVGFGSNENKTDINHIEYKVTIDDSVSMNEFLDKYEILDQEGKIYTVKEKE